MVARDIQDERHARIAKAAYFRWRNRGGGDGRDLADWYAAEKGYCVLERRRLDLYQVPSSGTRAFDERYIDAERFLSYVKEMQLFTSPNLSLLAFLERVDLLRPICRIVFPDPVIRAIWLAESPDNSCDAGLEVESKQMLVDAAHRLRNRLHGWHDPFVAMHEHPLDFPENSAALFISPHWTGDDPSPWECKNAVLSTADQVVSTKQATYTYYHYWQIFLVAEIAKTQLPVLLDTRLKTWSLQSEPYLDRDKWVGSVSLGIFIDKTSEYAACYEAVSFYSHYRSQAMLQCATHNLDGTFVVKGAALAEFQELERSCAQVAAYRSDVTAEKIREFIGFQCERRDVFRSSGPRPIVDEYLQQIEETIRFCRVLTGETFDQLRKHLSGFHARELDRLFPDWVIERRRQSLEWVQGSVQRWAHRASAYGLTEKECEDFVDWLIQRNYFQLFAAIEQFPQFGKEDPQARSTNLARSVQALTASIEHLLVETDVEHRPSLLSTPGKQQQATTMVPKIRRLWEDDQAVYSLLDGELKKGYAKSTTSIRQRRTDIATIDTGPPENSVVWHLVDASFLRNQTHHQLLTGLDDYELRDCLISTLRCIALIWKHADVRVWT